MWIEAELLSGPDAEFHLLGSAGSDRWNAATSGDFADHEFFHTYPDLTGNISGNITTEKVVVTTGAYMMLVENTAAGNIQPDESGEESVLNLRLYIESISSDGYTNTPADAQVFSISKARVFSQKK